MEQESRFTQSNESNALNVLERKKGKWEEIKVMPSAYDITGVKSWASMMRCDQCSFTTAAIEGRIGQYHFCPECGADMRGEGNDG